MYFKRITTDALMQFSYLAGDQGEAFVIDPRTDVEVYLELAAENNLQITAIFETHRNEDFLSGAGKLGELTGAPVYRSGYEDPGYTYGTTVTEDDSFRFGELTLKPLHTPGHTLGHLCYVLEKDERPYLVFTGDSLFYGGIGRTDFYGKDNLEKMTGLMYDSLFEKIRPLGDGVLVMPAHGAGSACGDDLDNIPLSTIGYAFADTETLPEDRDAFLSAHAYMRHKNPAFETMEKRNLHAGGELTYALPPVLLELPEEGKRVDLRDRFAFSAAHFPGSLYVPADLVPSYLGWFVGTDEEIVIIADRVSQELLQLAVASMRRQGFDRIRGVVAGGMLQEYANQGKTLAQLGVSFAEDYFSAEGKIHTLDVRKEEERDREDPVENRSCIPLQELKGEADTLPAEGPMYVVCQSGERATVAASYLSSVGRESLHVVQGGMMALEERA